MRISVVTISYNQHEYLRQCIESVLTQEYQDLEYIVVDPGSTDGSREIIESYGNRIVRIFEQDAGPADGLNRGFARATGDVLGFINADDYLLPGALTVVAAHFRQQGLNHFVSGCGFIEKPTKRRVRIQPTRLTKRRYLYGASTVFQQGTFFPRAYFEQIGGFNVRNRTCWDGELFLEFLCAGIKHEVVGNDLAVFRLHESSISGSERLFEVFQGDLDRIFREKVGRDRNVLDMAISWVLRGHKVLARTLQRIYVLGGS